MNPKENIRPCMELNDDELGGVSGGVQGPTPLQAPVQPMPSRPSIPPDPGLSTFAPTATPTPTPTPAPSNANNKR